MSLTTKLLTAAGSSAPAGQQEYTTPGNYSWVCPAGVTSVSVVVVGKGSNGGASAGALAYKNNISVTAGSSYTVQITSDNFQRSFFINSATVSAGSANARTGDGGGDGQSGAGGYSGSGGDYGSPNGANGSGGGGGGGGTSNNTSTGGTDVTQAGGGGVGLLGQGANGVGGAGKTNSTSAIGGTGGSGGAAGGNSRNFDGANGGDYGGNAGSGSTGQGFVGGKSALRIIWPGSARLFPSTRTANE
jgi:hypothetical protein